MSEEKSKTHFQFNGNNYNNWKYRMDILLEEKELIEYVEEDFEIITLHATDKEHKKHAKKEKLCKSLLVKHIADDQLEYVKDQNSAKEMYDNLRAVFQRKSMAGQLWLRKKLITLKYQDNGKMTEHLLEFDKIIRELRSIGGKMEEMDVVCQLLLSLPSSFDTLVTSLETLSPEMLNMEFVKSRLLDENNKRNGKAEVKYGTEFGGAMNANTYQYRCHNCGKEGHKRSECRYKSTGNSKTESKESAGGATESKEAAGNFADADEDDLIL